MTSLNAAGRGEASQTSARHIDILPQDKEIVVYCKSGIRSAEVLATLKAAGMTNSVHVQGGVIAWANQVERESDNGQAAMPDFEEPSNVMERTVPGNAH